MKSSRVVLMLAAAGVLTIAALAADVASAQPRNDRDDRGVSAAVDRQDGADLGPCGWPCVGAGGRGRGAGWGRGGRGMRGPGFQGPGAGGFGGPGMMGFGFGGALLREGSRIADALELTEAQREKIAAIREEHHREMIRARADLDLARMDLAKLLKDDQATMASIERQIDTMARLQADQMKGMAAAHRSARDVLTAKQREQLKNWRPGDGAPDSRERPRRNRR
jgi:Spy/CpxP family protein refolding chaperone